MARMARVIAEGVPHRVTQRGNARRAVFESDADRLACRIFSAGLLRFIGVMEILGGLGLVLPGMLRIRTELTALAAAGLVIIMIGAVVVTVQMMGIAIAAVPFVTGVLAFFGLWALANGASGH